jgi:putative acyl-CoA dehydrogenase
MCLDVLRAMARDADGCRAVLAELVREAENRPGVTRAAANLMKIVAGASAESAARGAVERLALIAAAAALQTSVPGTAAEAFARTRLGGQSSMNFGANELSAAETDMLLERALPVS